MQNTLMKMFRKVEEPKPALAAEKNSTFVYQKGSNVQAKWRKAGWVPPTEYRDDYEFKKNRDIELNK